MTKSTDLAQSSSLSGASRFGAWKWWVAIVLFLATVLTYLDRQTLSLCGPMICEEYSLSNEEYGKLVAAFRWSYAFVQFPAGYVADRFSLRLTYAFAVGLWSAAGAAAAFVSSRRQLLLTRAALGVGEAFNWPCATRIIANLHDPKDRALGSGIFNSGAAIGSLIAPAVITPIAIAYGWRAAFLVIGGVGLLWIPLWLWITRRASIQSSAVKEANHVTVGTIGLLRQWCRQVLLHPAFWMLLIVGSTMNPCWYFLSDWIPKYMHDQHGLGYLKAGLITIPIFLGADLGNLISGALVRLMARRGWSLQVSRSMTLSLAALLIAPVALIPSINQPSITIGFLAIAALGITSFVAIYTSCQQDFSFAHVGTVAGFLGMTCNLIAAAVNPWIGRYVDATGHYSLIFLLIGLLPFVALSAIVSFDVIMSRERVMS
jgi:ACS family hexuronate transporter-like MFS transporter